MWGRFVGDAKASSVSIGGELQLSPKLALVANAVVGIGYLPETRISVR